MSKLKSRNNLGQFERGVSLLITKNMQELAESYDINIKKDVRDKLKEVYINNVFKSYTEGYIHKGKASYHHTGKFIESIKVIIDDNVVKVTIDDSKKYENGKTAYDVYTFLTHGTTVHEAGYNPFISGKTKTENGRVSVYKSAERRPTPIHTFETDTLYEMELYLDELVRKIETNQYKGKWKRGGK